MHRAKRHSPWKSDGFFTRLDIPGQDIIDFQALSQKA